MPATLDRLAFAPPSAPGSLRALLLAVLVHGLLVAALSWGVQWKRQAHITTAQAELWSALPQEAAPRAPAAPPAAPPAPTPAAKPVPPAEPVTKPPQVDIALEREQRRLEQQRQLERDRRQEQQKQERLKLEKQKLDKLKLDKQKTEQRQQQLAQAAKVAQEQKAEEVQTRLIEAQREKNLQRLAGLAGTSDNPNASGSAANASGPSAGYAGRIRAKIRPNIVFTGNVVGNPIAEVEVHTALNGAIIARKLLKSSGNKSWDEAVLKAIDKTEILPRDTDGRVPPVLTIDFKPKD